jgi:hypothetical protein
VPFVSEAVIRDTVGGELKFAILLQCLSISYYFKKWDREARTGLIFFFFFFKDRFIALRYTIVYKNDHKTVPDTSLHEPSNMI